MYSHRIVLFIILVCHFNCPAFASNSSEDLNPAEKYVIEQVKKGELADFRKFPEDNRILSADFLKELLTGSIPGLELTKKGIHVYGARIKEKLDFSGEKISYPVSLRDCNFDKDIGFSQTTYSEEADFTEAKFSGGAYFGLAEFSGKAVFARVKFSGEAVFSSTKFSGEAVFSSTKFSGEADFSSAEYYEEADFLDAKFFAEADFTEGKFYGGAVFARTEFSGMADFPSTKFSEEADFSWAKFSGKADFSWSKFSGEADFSSAEYSEEAYFSKTKFSEEASFRKADLHKVDLSNADLSGADLSEVDLSEANLSDADLKDCILYSAKLPVIYEPKAGTPPYIPSIAGLPNLSALTFINSPHGLVDLREGFKKLGYRKQEREVTYAIKYKQRCNLWNSKESSIGDKLDSLIHLIFFEWTCSYGMRHRRLLVTLFLAIIPLFSIPYFVVLKWPPKREGIWKVWISERVRKDLGSEDPVRLKLNLFSALGFGFYFSVLSSFSIGWRELNVGNWIARIQRREYTLRASGWVRTVSGIQSLVSVYLLALWVLVYFGRPFEGI